MTPRRILLAVGTSALVHGALLWALHPGQPAPVTREVVPVELWHPAARTTAHAGDRSYASASPQAPGPLATPKPAMRPVSVPRARPGRPSSLAARPGRAEPRSSPPSGAAGRTPPAPPPAAIAETAKSAAAPTLPLPASAPVAGGGQMEAAPVLPGMAPSTVGASLTSRSGSSEGAGASSRAADGKTGGRPASAVADQRAALHRKLAQAARTCYPRAARRFRLKGTSRIHFCLDGSGSAGQVDLVESSGAALLDRAAQECVVPGAQPLPGTGCYTLGVEFTAP